MKKFTRTVAAVAAGVVAFSCASCGILPVGGAKTEDIVDAADSFAKALTSCDAGKIVKLTNEEKDSDTAEALSELFGGELLTADQVKVAEAVADTMTYEIDEESVKIDKDEASVDVTFTMVDYEAVLQGTFSDVNEAVAAIDDCDDTCEAEVTFEFAEEDGEWLISNLGDKAYTNLYSFYDLDVSFMPNLEELITDTFIAEDYSYLYMTVTFSEDITGYLDAITYDIFLDGELCIGDQEPYADSEQIWGDMSIDGPLESGTYTVVFYYDGVEFASDSIEVDNSGGGSGSGGQFYTDGNVYLCMIDYGEAIEDYLADAGYDVDMDGELWFTFELTLGTDGTYTFEPDLVTFETNLTEYLTNNMSDKNMIVFAGVSSADDLEATAAEMNMTVDELRAALIQAMVDSSIANVTDDVDSGTYTIDGDGISFFSNDKDDFTGTLGDGGLITLTNDYFAPYAGYIMEFYPEG